MAKVEDCPGFETFGADVKAAREANRLTRKTLQNWLGLNGGILPTSKKTARFPACL